MRYKILLCFIVCVQNISAQLYQFNWLVQNAEFQKITAESFNSHTAIYGNADKLKSISDSLFESQPGNKFFSGVNKKLLGVHYNLKPVFYVEAGADAHEKTLNTLNFGGVSISTDKNKKLYVEGIFTAHYAQIPKFALPQYAEGIVVPYFSEAVYNSENSFAWLNFSGGLRYMPSKYFGFELGKGTHKIGDGYRSLLLSENSAQYVYSQLDVNVWKFKYFAMLSLLTDFENGMPRAGLKQSFAVTHTLSYQVFKQMNIYFFESVLINPVDSAGYQGFDVSYLNPIVFYRPVEFANGSPDNVLMGIGGKLTVFNSVSLYAQGILDEFILSKTFSGANWWGNKFGFQLGIAKIGLPFLPNSKLLAEYNWVRPFTYSHENNFTNYGHAGQTLAHPFGANFDELLVQLSLSHKRIDVTLLASAARQGKDTSAVSLGNSPFVSYNLRKADEGNLFLQGERHTLLNGELRVAYCFNRANNFSAGFKIRYRTDTFSNTKNTYLGIHAFIGMSLFNDTFFY